MLIISPSLPQMVTTCSRIHPMLWSGTENFALAIRIFSAIPISHMMSPQTLLPWIKSRRQELKYLLSKVLESDPAAHLDFRFWELEKFSAWTFCCNLSQMYKIKVIIHLESRMGILLYTTLRIFFFYIFLFSIVFLC